MASNRVQRTTVHVDGMCCPTEVNAIRNAFNGVMGIEDISFDLLKHTMSVAFNPSSLSEDDILQHLKATGMKGKIQKQAKEESLAYNKDFIAWITVWVSAGFILLAIFFMLSDLSKHITRITLLLAVVSAAWTLAPKAIRSFLRLRMDMNVLMAIAVLGALGLGEYFEAATVSFLFALSQMLERYSMDRAKSAIHSLMVLTPDTASVIRAGKETIIPVDNVKVGEIVRIRPGDRVPLDGIVINGHSYVNEAPITGESLPAAKESGSSVYAGSLNQDGSIAIRVEKPAYNSLISKVLQLVDQAKSMRAPVENFVEKFARYYTPTVIALAVCLTVVPPLILGNWGEWFYRALVLLVISCPCALVISTPVSIVSALASAARNGVLIKGGTYLEEAGRSVVVAFDKTGTLTTGTPKVMEVIPLNGMTRDRIVEIAASISHHSQHPLSKAICAYAKEQSVQYPQANNFISLPGRGAMAEVSSTEYWIGNRRLFEEKGMLHPELQQNFECFEQDRRITIGIASADQSVGCILLSDSLRDQAPQTVLELNRLGIYQIFMLTGDNAGTAQRVARETGISLVHSGLLPQDKVRLVEDLVHKHQHVLMVGDGVNDAPALAAASVGVAMGAMGSDIALESAPVALMKDDLRKIPWLIRHSRRAGRIIRWNIGLALGLKLIFVLLAIPGWATLWMAVTADMGASLLVIANGLRLLRINEQYV